MTSRSNSARTAAWLKLRSLVAVMDRGRRSQGRKFSSAASTIRPSGAVLAQRFCGLNAGQPPMTMNVATVSAHYSCDGLRAVASR